jgi:hypothetical protein
LIKNEQLGIQGNEQRLKYIKELPRPIGIIRLAESTVKTFFLMISGFGEKKWLTETVSHL